jgi:hypothetical protein
MTRKSFTGPHSLRCFGVIALGFAASACGGGGDHSGPADASSTVDSAVDGAVADSSNVLHDTGTSKDGDSSASPPEAGVASDGAADASTVDAGLPDASCPPLQATGLQILDTTTNLTWTRFAYPPAIYTDATTKCAGMGARLPTQSELTAFASTAYSAIGVCSADLSLPWPASGDPMWTTTMDTANPNFFITVYYTGLTTSHPKTDGVGYICVKP